jgi:hypothetical protein
MSDIYSRAKFVFIWLGNDLETEIEKERAAELVNFGWQPDLRAAHLALQREERDAASMIDAPVCTPKVTEAQLKNSCWARLWIIQEFCLVKDLLLCVGAFVINWKDFRDSIEDLGKTFHVEDSYMSNLMHQRYHREPGESQDRLPSLIQKFYTTRCAAPGDRVFGLLGISCTSIAADCSRSNEEVFYDVVKAELEAVSGDDDFDALHLFCLQELSVALKIDSHRAEKLFRHQALDSSSSHSHNSIFRLASKVQIFQLEGLPDDMMWKSLRNPHKPLPDIDRYINYSETL